MRRDGNLSMLEKAALILGAFRSGPSLSLRDLGERTGLPRSTVHRLVRDVEQLGWLVRVGPRYQLGVAVFELGELVPLKQRLRAAALPFMQDLFAATGHTVHLAVRDGLDAVYAEKIHGHQAAPLPSRTGGRTPLTCTAVGKALLAHEAPAVLAEVLDRPLRTLTDRSVTDPARLRQELAGVRRNGFAVEREEAALGSCCVAAPVLGAEGVLAAVSVSAPLEQFHAARLAPAVRTAALGLTRLLTGAADRAAAAASGGTAPGPAVLHPA